MQLQNDLLADIILNSIASINVVKSVSLVGSFSDNINSNDYSDIDIVVILETLTEKAFQECVLACETLDGHSMLKGKKIFVNKTFGPLKFDNDDNIVLHLMVYDVAGHTNHVIESPFTCLDWERSNLFRGMHMSEIASVGKLSIHDFTAARRNLNEYEKELSAGVTSYRYYNFTRDGYKEVKAEILLDERGKAEFIYHIIKNSLQNLNKMLLGKNVPLSEKRLSHVSALLYENSYEFLMNFKRLQKLKYENSLVFDNVLLRFCLEFLIKFNEALEHIKNDLKTITFLRHARTELNDGRFLGQNLDPEIRDKHLIKLLNCDALVMYSSPSTRCKQTADLLGSKQEVIIDERLSEIDYGLAEGLTIEELRDRYPQIINAWMSGNDPKFPDGECQSEVLSRLNSFLSDLNTHKGNQQTNVKAFAVITHNVVLRSLLGSYFGIPVSNWYEIVIPHVEPINGYLCNNNLIIDYDRKHLLRGLTCQ